MSTSKAMSAARFSIVRARWAWKASSRSSGFASIVPALDEPDQGKEPGLACDEARRGRIVVKRPEKITLGEMRASGVRGL